MACGYCPVLFCIDVLGIKQEISGTVAALLSWLQEARATSTGFSSVFLLFMLTQFPPPLLCILMSCISTLPVCHCKRENKLDSGGLKGCKWLLIPRPLALLEVGGEEGCVLGDRACMFVGVLAWVSDRMYMIMIFLWICFFWLCANERLCLEGVHKVVCTCVSVHLSLLIGRTWNTGNWYQHCLSLTQRLNLILEVFPNLNDFMVLQHECMYLVWVCGKHIDVPCGSI